MNKKSIGFKIGIVTASLHLAFALFTYLAVTNSTSSTAAIGYIWVEFLDAPLEFIFPEVLYKLMGNAVPFIEFVLLGSLMWFFIPWSIDKIIVKLRAKAGTTLRIVLNFILILLLIICFIPLNFYSVSRSIKKERPEELKGMLDKASTDFLTEKVIYPGRADNISIMNCRTLKNNEILISYFSGVVFLDKEYKVLHKIEFTGKEVYTTLQPLYVDYADKIHSCGYIGYRLMKGVDFLDSQGNILWSINNESEGDYIHGVKSGDLNGDGNLKFTIYYEYRKGIHLVNIEGKTIWKLPVYSIDNLEIYDTDDDGKSEIIYSNSNCNTGKTVFTFLDANKRKTKELVVPTESSEFSFVRWPDEKGAPNILLTEDNTIRIIDFAGKTIMKLDAPGSRTFGDIAAITVKLKKDEPRYLAVRKKLHPDLNVLYIYDSTGVLKYQKTEVSEIPVEPLLTAVSFDDSNTEKLLTGSAKGYSSEVKEYSLRLK